MAIVGVAGDVAVEDRKRRRHYGCGTKERFGAVLVITVAVNGESETVHWKTKIGWLSDLSDRGSYCFIRGVPGEGLTMKGRRLYTGSKPRGLLRRKLGQYDRQKYK